MSLIERFPDFGSQYDQSKMNQLVAMLKGLLSKVEYGQGKVVVVDGASYTCDGTESIFRVTATATTDSDINLPLASLMKGRVLYFHDAEDNATAHPYTINAAGSDLIDNNGPNFLASADGIRIILWCDGIGWWSMYDT